MKTSDTNAIIVLCTAPDKNTAQNLATKVLDERLVACVTLLPDAISLYYWKGKLEKKHEIQMLLKTNLIYRKALFDCLKSYHPYQIPELLAFPIFYGNDDYLSWINSSLC